MEGGEEARQRREPARPAGELPGQHAAPVPAGLAQGGAPAADAGEDAPQARQAHGAGHRDEHHEGGGEHGQGRPRRGAQLRADAQHQGRREDDQADGQLARPLGHERARQQRAAGARSAPGEQQHAHRVAAARGRDATGTGAGDPRRDGVAGAKRGILGPGCAHEHVPPAAAQDLVGEMQRDAERQPSGGSAGDGSGEGRERAFAGSRKLDRRVPHRGLMVPLHAYIERAIP